jgi:hypothetical protein
VTDETKQVMMAIMIKLAIIPGVITPSSNPMADAAMIRFRLDDMRKPPATACLNPNNCLQSTAETNFTAKSVTNRRTRNPVSVLFTSILHGILGDMVFTFGLGSYFWLDMYKWL